MPATKTQPAKWVAPRPVGPGARLQPLRSFSYCAEHEMSRNGGRAVHGIVPPAFEFRWAQYRVGLPREWPPGEVRHNHQAGRRDARRWPIPSEDDERSRHRRAASRSGGATSAERDGRPVFRRTYAPRERVASGYHDRVPGIRRSPSGGRPADALSRCPDPARAIRRNCDSDSDSDSVSFRSSVSGQRGARCGHGLRSRSRFPVTGSVADQTAPEHQNPASGTATGTASASAAGIRPRRGVPGSQQRRGCSMETSAVFTPKDE
jgi:hypothetical protein